MIKSVSRIDKSYLYRNTSMVCCSCSKREQEAQFFACDVRRFKQKIFLIFWAFNAISIYLSQRVFFLMLPPMDIRWQERMESMGDTLFSREQTVLVSRTRKVFCNKRLVNNHSKIKSDWQYNIGEPYNTRSIVSCFPICSCIFLVV